MKTSRFAWVVILWGATAGGLLAQPVGKSGDAGQMYEDIEVMRRILSQKLDVPSQWGRYASMLSGGGGLSGMGTGFSGTGTGFAGMGSGFGGGPGFGGMGTGTTTFGGGLTPHGTLATGLYAANAVPAVREAADVDGTYLKGYGVMFNVGVPAGEKVVIDPTKRAVGLASACVKCHTAGAPKVAEAPAPQKSPSLWDQTRAEVRGTKPAPKPTPATVKQEICQPGNLADKILTALAENGHNFSQLAGDEKLTVAITFHGARPQRSASRSGSGGGSTTGTSSGGGLSADETVARDAELLADLHIKQGKHSEAVAAYEKALKAYGVEVQLSPNTPAEEAKKAIERLTEKKRQLTAKLASAYLAKGDVENARKTLEGASGVKVGVRQPSGGSGAGPAKEKEPAAHLPGKLIVSVPRSALDAVHSGKQTYADFAASASVETVNLTAPPPEKK